MYKYRLYLSLIDYNTVTVTLVEALDFCVCINWCPFILYAFSWGRRSNNNNINETLFSYFQFVSHFLDCIDHVQSHFHATHGVILSGLRETRHAVITISQQLDAKTVVFLKSIINCRNDNITEIITFRTKYNTSIYVPRLVYRNWRTDRSTLWPILERTYDSPIL